MALPTTREEFKAYCLRNLGAPVLKINVDDEQVEDRIDEALQYWWEYHFSGSQKIYFKHQVTETNKTNGYIEIPEYIIGVIDIFNISSYLSSGGALFNAQYQFVLNNVNEFVKYDLVNYSMTLQYMSLMDEMLSGSPPIRYNRHSNKLYIDTDWSILNVGDYIIAECYGIVDPAEHSDVWKDQWLLNYATALIQRQWGRTLIKFEGMQLPGGVTFNGERILSKAEEEIAKLQEEMIVSFSLPVHDLIG